MEEGWSVPGPDDVSTDHDPAQRTPPDHGAAAGGRRIVPVHRHQHGGNSRYETGGTGSNPA